MSKTDKALSPIIDLVKGVTDSAFVVDKDRKIEDFNRPFLMLHQIDRRKSKALNGNFCRDHVNLEICEKNCIVKQCLESGVSVRFDEVKGKTIEGNDLNLIVTAIPIKNASGDVVSVLEVHRDVTDEARIHAKYKILLDKEKLAKEELERLVDERTKELRATQSQLVHSEKMSSLGQMVAGIAHELNNPINFIYGNSESLVEYRDDLEKLILEAEKLVGGDPSLLEKFSNMKTQIDYDFVMDDFSKVVKSIRHGSERAAEIIQGLRTFSRLDEAQVKETDIHQDIDMTLTLLRNEYKNRITVHRDFAELPLVPCFASQLNQVYMNILHNAAQAIEGEGEVWLKTYVKDDMVHVEIKDNGGGIPQKHLAKIFDPFYTTKEIGKGTGLGLSISYGIVERHGGRIEVESEEGKGTTFTIVVPLSGPPKEGKSES